MKPMRDSASDSQEHEPINLLFLLGALRAEWRMFSGIVGVFIAISVTVALLMTPVYRAEAIVTPVDSNRSNSSSLVGQLGGLASLTGMNLASLTGSPNKGGIMIQSRSLIEEFIKRNDLVQILFESDKDSDSRLKPTLWQAVEAFKKIFTVEEDVKTGLITARVEWTDPHLAAEWANKLVLLSNEMLRQGDLTDAERNIKYLKEQLSQTNVVGLQNALYNLIEVEMRTVMLANARQEYALAFVDEAVVPELRIRPKRTQLVVLGTLLGGIFGVFVIAIRRTLRDQRERNLGAAASTGH